MKRASRHQRLLHRSRRGFSLVWFALIFFGLLGLAALVIDLGLARVTQRQLQSAADMAALEGLRGTPNEEVETMSRLVFDSGLETASGSAPVIEFTGGVDLGDGFLAGQTMKIDESQSYLIADDTDPDPALVRYESSIPYFFGRGSLLHLQLKGSGVTVRGESGASSAAALSVGKPHINSNSPGAIRQVVMELPQWVAIPVDEQIYEITASGDVLRGSLIVGFVGEEVPGSPPYCAGDTPQRDQQAALSAVDLAEDAVGGVAYVPLLDAGRVVGFGKLKELAAVDSSRFRATKPLEESERTAVINATTSTIRSNADINSVLNSIRNPETGLIDPELNHLLLAPRLLPDYEVNPR